MNTKRCAVTSITLCIFLYEEKKNYNCVTENFSLPIL